MTSKYPTLARITAQYASDHLVGRCVTAVTATNNTITFTLADETAHTLCSYINLDDSDYLAFVEQPKTYWFNEFSRCVEGLLTMVHESTAALIDRGVLYESPCDPNTDLMPVHLYNQQVVYRTAVYNSLLYTGALPGEVALCDLDLSI